MKKDDFSLTTTEGDRKFVAYIQDGMTKAEAFELSYPENKKLKEYQEIREKGIAQRKPSQIDFANRRIYNLAHSKTKTNKIKILKDAYVDRLKELVPVAIDVAEDILLNGKSEMVRSQVALRIIEHEKGTPVQKQAIVSQGELTVLMGEAPKDNRDSKLVAEMKKELGNELDVESYNKSIKKEPFKVEMSNEQQF